MADGRMKALVQDLDEEDMEGEEAGAESDEPELSLWTGEWRPEPPQRRHVSVLYMRSWGEVEAAVETSRESQHKRARVFDSGE
jgi:hypothetical protein